MPTRTLCHDFRHLSPTRAREAQDVFDEILGDAPVKGTVLDLLTRMERHLVRHPAPHSGGLVPARDPRTPRQAHRPLQRRHHALAARRG